MGDLQFEQPVHDVPAVPHQVLIRAGGQRGDRELADQGTQFHRDLLAHLLDPLGRGGPSHAGGPDPGVDHGEGGDLEVSGVEGLPLLGREQGGLLQHHLKRLLLHPRRGIAGVRALVAAPALPRRRAGVRAQGVFPSGCPWTARNRRAERPPQPGARWPGPGRAIRPAPARSRGGPPNRGCPATMGAAWRRAPVRPSTVSRLKFFIPALMANSNRGRRESISATTASGPFSWRRSHGSMPEGFHGHEGLGQELAVLLEGTQRGFLPGGVTIEGEDDLPARAVIRDQPTGDLDMLRAERRTAGAGHRRVHPGTGGRMSRWSSPPPPRVGASWPPVAWPRRSRRAPGTSCRAASPGC